MGDKLLVHVRGEVRPPAIGVDQEARRRPAVRQRQGLGREMLIERRSHGPADDAAGIEVEHDGEV